MRNGECSQAYICSTRFKTKHKKQPTNAKENRAVCVLCVRLSLVDWGELEITCCTYSHQHRLSQVVQCAKLRARTTHTHIDACITVELSCMSSLTRLSTLKFPAIHKKAPYWTLARSFPRANTNWKLQRIMEIRWSHFQWLWKFLKPVKCTLAI